VAPAVGSNAQIKSPETSRSAAELRPIVIVGFGAGVLTPAGIALREHGLAAWILSAISVSIASIALYRFQKELHLLKGRTTAIARVTDWNRTENSEGGYSYSVRYEFVAPDGNKYVGKETTQVELPKKGEMLPISYRRDDPTHNLPLATFWFFHFTYSGFSEWMDC
jgi:hypothetical protein